MDWVVMRRLCFLLVFLVPSVSPITRDFLYRYDDSSDNKLPREDDVSSEEIHLNVPIVFHNVVYKSIFVNSNGLLSFRTEIPSFLNIEFPLNYPIIAPFYTNVDTTQSGAIFYRESQQPDVLQKATNSVRNYFYVDTYFQATSVFVATWLDVGYHPLGTDKLNTFQVAVISDGNDSYVEFLYPEGDLQWIQGTGSESGLPDAKAQAGFCADGNYLTLDGSGTDRAINLDTWSNTDTPGHWIFHIGRIGGVNVVETAQRNTSKFINTITSQSSCAEASIRCHQHAQCVDKERGFCCICQNGYYGDGITCLKNDVPLRAAGKVSGIINGVEFRQLDLQSYIVMSDGRAYTAISKLPPEIGFGVQTLQTLGNVIGWLFAQPVYDTKNGFQYTGGVFNHTAVINFTNTNHQVTINQKFVGLNVFDQLKLEIYINGTIPTTPESAISFPDFEEVWKTHFYGVLESSATHYYTFEGTEYSYNIFQVVNFTPCKYDFGETEEFKLKVARNFITYEKTEQVNRFGITSKVTPLADINPCDEGRKSCGDHSTCVVDGESYRCVCIAGYQLIYQDNNQICVDINECQSGTHYCDLNAQCINHPGSFACRCNPGFLGDGRTCQSTEADPCDGVNCGENAECINYQGPRCQCKAGFRIEGGGCVPEIKETCDIANDCSPYGVCSIDPQINEYYCSCLPGYEGDGYNCQKIETITTTLPPTTTEESTTEIIEESCTLDACWCTEGYEKMPGTKYCARRVDRTSSSLPSPSPTPTDDPSASVAWPQPQCFYPDVCACPLNYILDSELKHCRPDPNKSHETMGISGNKIPCNILNNCHPHAQCIFDSSEGKYLCSCNAGYIGDGYECLIKELSCDIEPAMCDIHASCINIDGNFICVCSPGYNGDGIACRIADECTSSIQCRENQDCIYSSLHGRYECSCIEGYGLDAYNTCIKMKGTCGGGTCVPQADCLFDPNENINYCHCKDGYVGDGITHCNATCAVLNDCGLHANCEPDASTQLYQCKCADGYYGDGYYCSSEVTCAVDSSICDRNAQCQYSNGRHYCACNPSYIGNGTHCTWSPSYRGKFLLVNQGMATLRIPLNPTLQDPGGPIQINAYQQAVGIDVDCSQRRVYWSDVEKQAITSSDYEGNDVQHFIAENIGAPEGLSIDWVSRNIYWTDSKFDTIEVANLQTKLRKKLFDTGISNPRGIAVHPHRGKLFWSDWNRSDPKIEWANLDGTDRAVLLNEGKVKLPNSLAIDWITDYLCYADAGTNKIECMNIDTREIQTIYDRVLYPFSLTISETTFYWSDWNSSKIESVDRYYKVRQPPIKVPLAGTGKLFGVVHVLDTCIDFFNYCRSDSGQNCPNGHICLPHGLGYHSCVCADNPQIVNATC